MKKHLMEIIKEIKIKFGKDFILIKAEETTEFTTDTSGFPCLTKTVNKVYTFKNPSGEIVTYDALKEEDL